MANKKKKTTGKKKNISKKSPVKKVSSKEVVKSSTNATVKKNSTSKKKNEIKKDSKKTAVKKTNPTIKKKSAGSKSKVAKVTVTKKTAKKVSAPNKVSSKKIEKAEEKKKIDLKEHVHFGNIVIAVIILGALVLFGITIANTLLRLNKVSQYNKKVKIVEKAAIKWAEDNEIGVPIHITVNQLIRDKYVIPDEANGNYINPRNSSKTLNCNTIFIDKGNGEYETKFNEETDCDLMLAEQLPIELMAKVGSGRDIKSAELVASDIVLVVYSRLELKNVIWYDDGEEVVSNRGSNSYIITTNKNVYKTIRVVVDCNRGRAEYKFVANIQKEN